MSAPTTPEQWASASLRELTQMRRDDPDGYARLRDQHLGARHAIAEANRFPSNGHEWLEASSDTLVRMRADQPDEYERVRNDALLAAARRR